MHAGLVGYAHAAATFPDLAPSQYENIYPSNQALFNRSVFDDPTSLYNLTSWTPQVALKMTRPKPEKP